MSPLRPLLLLLPLAALAACSDSNSLADPTDENVVEENTIGSLKYTPITTASGYSISTGPIRTDQTGELDFAFDIDGDPATGQPVLLPRAVLGIVSSGSADPGIQKTTQEFDKITEAPSNGYITDQKVPVAVGDRLLVRSRVICSIGVPIYAKLEVLSIEDAEIHFKVLTDQNCGYRGLEPGFPDK
ncbi:MAG TPA: hypothetical protein VJQ44_09485 [Gemmatimonadales bacterium]|nr:hypothetical protein [Gemmatimonadales bacterium]